MAWFVYMGVNKTEREIYFGVSKDPVYRVDGSHCRGGTKAVRHWDCEDDRIDWEIVRAFDTQKEASAFAHAQERRRAPKGYVVIQTAGI